MLIGSYCDTTGTCHRTNLHPPGDGGSIRAVPTEEASGVCGYCQRPVLGRREGINHVLYAILTLFSCGLFGLVWLAAHFTRGEYACPTCGGRVAVQ